MDTTCDVGKNNDPMYLLVANSPVSGVIAKSPNL